MMYRPFLFVAVFFLSGIVVGYFIQNIWVFLFFAGLNLIASLFIKEKQIRAAFIGLSLFFFGAFYFNLRASGMAGAIATYAGKQETIIGMVNDTPTIEADKIRYDIRTLYILENNTYKKVSGRIALSVPLDEKNQNIFRFGNVLKFSGKLKLPLQKRNPGGMDYRASLLQKGISATIFSRQVKYMGPWNVNPFINAAYSLRERISDFYYRNLPPNLSALLVGIVLGLKGNISGETLKAFSDAGTIHLLAVSGMNTAIIYGSFQSICDLFYVPKIFSFILGLLATLFYSFMAGLSPSVTRATVMIGVLMLGRLVARKNDALNSLSFAAILLLLINPLNLFSVSFQLSFAATLGIILFYNPFKNFFGHLPNLLKDAMSIVLSAQLLVWPIAAYYFHRISLVGFISNLFIVPLVSVVLILGIVSALFGLIFPPQGILLLKITGFLLALTERATILSSRVPLATIVVPAMSPVIILLYFTMVAIAFNIFRLPFGNIQSVRRYAAALLVMVCLFMIVPKNSGMEITFVDVGQGDCIFIRTSEGRTLLIDGGGMPGYYKGDFDVGADVVEPFLFGRGVDDIDVVVFSHFDDDHARGLLTILKDMKVGTVLYGVPSDSDIYKTMVEASRQKHIKILPVAAKDRFYLGSTTFEVLNPPRESMFADENNNSVVLKMTYNGMSFLFTGDLGIEGERRIMSSGEDLTATVLKAGHHGSAKSTSEEFLARVNPAFAVISAGKDNSFGHPSARVMDLFQQRGIKVFRTDDQGAITFKIYKNNVKIFTSISEEM